MSRIDPHSYVDSSHPRTKHLKWKANVDFAKHVIDAESTLVLAGESSGTMDVDTKGLTIHSVVNESDVNVPYELGEEDAILGRRLRLQLPKGTHEVRIRYQTSPEAIALQWLTPEQTEGKGHPFLFSQCQAIHARTMLPVQDTPAIRISYSAEVTVPEPLSAVMSAGPAGTKAGSKTGTRTFLFEMPQPIPPYLMALAVGELESRDLSKRSRVWAEPATVDKAAWEFADIEKMIVTAERMFGPYEWDRYDMLVLPPSFPYGGMENPRMTFLTPTLLAGDRSLVNVVSHELAHSWTGNLVTNSNMDHFWLNEGWTVWAERRISEAIWGEDEVKLQWAIGQKDLEQSIARFGQGSPLTRLRMELENVDPDDAFSSVPYEKGSRFIALIEQTVGREKFDHFVREYIAKYRFTSMTSEQFIEFLDEKLPGVSTKVDWKTWLYQPDMPANAPVFRSSKVDEIARIAEGWGAGVRPSPEQIKGWKTSELVAYLQRVPHDMDAASAAWLEKTFALTSRGNYEILVEWLVIAAGSDYEPAFGRIREVLMRVGRMKYLRPLYLALGKHPRTRALARDIFAAAAPTYHSLSRRVVESEMSKYPA